MAAGPVGHHGHRPAAIGLIIPRRPRHRGSRRLLPASSTSSKITRVNSPRSDQPQERRWKRRTPRNASSASPTPSITRSYACSSSASPPSSPPRALLFLLLTTLHRQGQRQTQERSLGSLLVLAPLYPHDVRPRPAWRVLGDPRRRPARRLACYREFARATGMFRDPLISASPRSSLGILAITAAVLDHWYGLFAALPPIMMGLMAAIAILADQPKGYIQRLALGIFAFMLFGVCCGHLGYFANDPDYRPILLWLISSVELNDIFAYITGKSFGRRKLAPNTSPNKTIGGALGALILTTTFAAAILGPLRLRRKSRPHPDQPVAPHPRRYDHQHHRPIRRPHPLLRQTRPGHQRLGQHLPRPRRPARPLQLPPLRRPRDVPFHHISSTISASINGSDFSFGSRAGICEFSPARI